MEKSYKVIIIIFSIINFAFTQSGLEITSKIPPTVKSAILPGWGEYDLDKSKRGNFFITTEIIGVVLTTFSFVKSKNISTTYQAMAAEYGNVITHGKNHQYWVDIGNYASLGDYNDEHLRWREFDNLYPDEEIWNWNWETEDKRKEFEDLRIESDRMRLVGKFFIGGIVLNHIISVIDVYYLKNISLKDKIEFSSYLNTDNNALIYSVQFNL